MSRGFLSEDHDVFFAGAAADPLGVGIVPIESGAFVEAARQPCRGQTGTACGVQEMRHQFVVEHEEGDVIDHGLRVDKIHCAFRELRFPDGHDEADERQITQSVCPLMGGQMRPLFTFVMLRIVRFSEQLPRLALAALAGC